MKNQRSTISICCALALSLGTTGSALGQSLQQRLEQMREQAEQRAEQMREAQQRLEEQRQQAEQRAEQQREAQQRAEEARQQAQQREEQQREAQQRAAQEREAQQREAQQREAQQRQAQQQAEEQRRLLQQQQQQQQQREAMPPRPASSQPTEPVQGTAYRPGSASQPAAPSTGTVYRPGTSTIPPPKNDAGAMYRPGATSAPTPGANSETVYRPGTGQINPQTDPFGRAISIPRPAPRTAPVRPVYTPPQAAAVASRTPNASVLTPSGSSQVVQQVNAARANMRGINAKPIPAGEITIHANGDLRVQNPGRIYEIRKDGTVASIATLGKSVSFRPSGRVSRIETPVAEIRRGVNGERVVLNQRRDGAVVVSTGPRHGYVERTVLVNNRRVIERTYVAYGHVFTRAFVPYSYGALLLPRYVPAFYFAPPFYGWAFYAWSGPVSYTWAWVHDPWFGFYAAYFQPEAVYQSATAWLADYLMSRTLADAYAMRDQDVPLPGDQEVAGEAGDDELYAQNDTPITPEIKAAISSEIARQLSYENAISQGKAPETVQELPAALKTDRIFIVSTALDVFTTDQQDCELTPGDVLQLAEPPSTEDTSAALLVASSKRNDCPAGVKVNVSVSDLAEMRERSQGPDGCRPRNAALPARNRRAVCRSAIGSGAGEGFSRKRTCAGSQRRCAHRRPADGREHGGAVLRSGRRWGRAVRRPSAYNTPDGWPSGRAKNEGKGLTFSPFPFFTPFRTESRLQGEGS